MAIVKAPFLSLGATGQLGKTIVMSTWKGIKTAREYVVPANPRTIAQVAQRALMTAVTAFYKNLLTNAATRTGWNLSATLSGKPQSGYNAFASAALTWLAAVADGPLAGAPQVWVGSTPTNLALAATGESTTYADLFGLSMTYGTGNLTLACDNMVEPSSPYDIIVPVAITGTKYVQVKLLCGGVAYPITGVTALTV